MNFSTAHSGNSSVLETNAMLRQRALTQLVTELPHVIASRPGAQRAKVSLPLRSRSKAEPGLFRFILGEALGVAVDVRSFYRLHKLRPSAISAILKAGASPDEPADEYEVVYLEL